MLIRSLDSFLFVWVNVYLSAFVLVWVAIAEYCGLRGLDNKNVFLLVLEARGPRSRHLQTWCLVGTCYLVPQAEVDASSPVSSCKDANPIARAHPSWTHHLPKSLPPDTILGPAISTSGFWADTDIQPITALDTLFIYIFYHLVQKVPIPLRTNLAFIKLQYIIY